MKEKKRELLPENEIKDDIIEHKKCYSLKRLVFLINFLIFFIFFLIFIACQSFSKSDFKLQSPIEIEKIISKSNIIKKKEEFIFLRDSLGKEANLKMFFNSKIDGDSPGTLKNKINQNQILVLIETENGNRFGGYTPLNFKKSTLIGSNPQQESSFLFNIDSKRVFNIRNSENTSSNLNSNRLKEVFFGNDEIIVYENFYTKGGSSTSPNYYGEYSEPFELTNGEKDFKVKYLEAFNVFFPSSSKQKNFKNEIDAALFDVDGTLLDTEPIYEKAAQEIINLYGNGKKYDWDVKEKVIGGKEEAGAKAIIEAYNVKLSIKEYLEKRNEIAKELFRKCPPCSGAKEITKKLKHEYGLKMAFATSSTHNLFGIKSENHLEWFEQSFDKYIFGDDKRLKRSKPSPDIFLLSAKELGVDPNRCIIFEDAINGVKAALESGAAVVVAVPMPHFRKFIEKLEYDKSKTQLIILDSLNEFDFSLIKKKK